MALRLAGEPFLAIQGADNQGWVREIAALDALPGLKIDQQSTGHIFDFQDGGVSRMFMQDGGSVLLANAPSPPSAPDRLLHVWGGNAGAIGAQANSLLVVENGGDAILQFLTPGTSNSRVAFGNPGSANDGIVEYVGADNKFRIATVGVDRVFISAGVFAFQEPTAIKTTAGNLTLDPAGHVALPSTKRLYLDNGGDTYVHQVSNDVVEWVIGGTVRINHYANTFRFHEATDIITTAASNGDVGLLPGGTGNVKFGRIQLLALKRSLVS